MNGGSYFFYERQKIICELFGRKAKNVYLCRQKQMLNPKTVDAYGLREI